MVALKCRKIRR